MNKFVKAQKFLTENAKLAGFDGYNIVVVDMTDHNEEYAAKTQVFAGAKVLSVELYSGWDTEPHRDWKNILLHELLHARIGMIFDDFIESTQALRYKFEEQAVCDITRGMQLLQEKKRR